MCKVLPNFIREIVEDVSVEQEAVASERREAFNQVGPWSQGDLCWNVGVRKLLELAFL